MNYLTNEPIQDTINKIFINNTNILDPNFIFFKKFDSKKEPVYSLIELNLDEILTNFTSGVNVGSNTFKTLYNKYKTKNLTPELFKVLIEHTLYTNVPFLFKDLESSLNDFYNYSKNKRIELRKYYSQKIVIGSQVKKQLINYLGSKPVYFILNCNVNFNIINTKGIDLLKLIKEYPLSEIVPYMNYQGIVKTYTGFNFKNEKSYNDKLILKLKYTNNYALCYIYANGNIILKYNFKKEDNITFDNLFDYTKTIFQKSKITQFLNLNKISDINTTYTIISFEINKNSKYSSIQTNINTEPFEIQPKLKKDILTLKFKSNGGNSHSIIINNKFYNTKITAYGFTFEKELFEAIDGLLNIFYRTENRKNLLKSKQEIKKKDIGINTTSCQKIRQPTLIKGPYHTTTYPLKDPKTNHSFTCNSKKFPYPGFTNLNTICCFKKDQRNKYIFKKNIGSIINENHFLDDTELLNNPIIKTNKALEPNRIGVFNKLKKFVNNKNDFFRLGNDCGLLGAVELLLKKKIDTSKITLSEKVFMSLDNGDICSKYKLHDYLNLIKINSIKLGLLEVLAHHTQLNFMYVTKEKILLYKGNKTNKTYIISDCNELIINVTNSKIIRTFDINQFITSKTPLQTLVFNGINVFKQFVVNGKVLYVSTNYGILPITNSGILLDYPITFKFNLTLLTLYEQYNFLIKLNLKILGQFTSQIDTGSAVEGLVVKLNNNNIIIPTKKSKELIKDIKLFYLQFVPSINSVDTFTSKSNQVLKYGLDIDIYNEIYERIRYLLNVIQINYGVIKHTITDKEIINILTPYITFGDININTISDVFNIKTICTNSLMNNSTLYNEKDIFCYKNKLKIPKVFFKGIIKKIVMDINTYNPRGKQIISGKINKEYFNKDNFIKRSGEKIMFNDY